MYSILLSGESEHLLPCVCTARLSVWLICMMSISIKFLFFLTSHKPSPKHVCLLALKIYVSPEMLVSGGLNTRSIPSYYHTMVSSDLSWLRRHTYSLISRCVVTPTLTGAIKNAIKPSNSIAVTFLSCWYSTVVLRYMYMFCATLVWHLLQNIPWCR